MNKPFLQVVLTIHGTATQAGHISIPDVVTEREYDFVIVGAPTCGYRRMSDALVPRTATADKVLKGKPFTAVVACRRYWSTTSRPCDDSGPSAAGIHEGIHFRYQGGQVLSLFSLLSYLGTGEYKDKFHGVKIPPTNLRTTTWSRRAPSPAGVADRLVGVGTTTF